MPSVLPRATQPSNPRVPPEFIKAASPLLFAALFNWALYGALCVQIYVYSYNFPNDRRIVKCLAYLVFLIETVQTGLTAADIYYWFIEGFGDIDYIKNSHYAPIYLPIMGAAISFIVQEYFCYRIWTLTRKTRPSWLCVVVAFVSTLQAVGASWGGIVSLINRKYVVSKVAFFLWSLPTIFADVLIAVGMTLVLRQARVSGGRFTNFALLRLVRLTVETNALTTGVAFSAFVLFLAYPNEIYYTFPVGIIGKVYSNTLLVSLNNRIYFRDHPSPGITVLGEAGDHGVASNPLGSRPAIAIHVTQVKHTPPQTITGNGFEMGVVSSHPVEGAKGDGLSISSDPSS